MLIGFPSDSGVTRNGGRPGAAQGPTALREALYRMTPDARCLARFTALLDRTLDSGDVPVSGDLEQDQVRLAEAVGAALASGAVPIVLGGGHETAYGHALGYLTTGRRVSLLNWDAHADVRTLVDGRGHSGSPFRQALEHASGLAVSYTAAGLLPWRVASDHAAYVEAHGAVVWGSDLDAGRIDHLVDALDAPTYVSFDLDAVDGVAGVSAPGVGGMAAGLWLHAAEACARSRHVTSLDVVELSPPHDADGRAATLAALTVWHMLRGLSERDA